jgi:2-amino-4-hydroxy-6-hydroxymethyldihydropteridine diphosphokinase
MRLGYLGLGSNLGDRRAHLQAAVEALWAHHIQVLRASSVYETEPVGEIVDQPDFLNACVQVETVLRPEPALDACKAVEAALGRELGGAAYVRHGPRAIDVDVLLLGDEAYSSERLRIPHPELTARRFVLVPLLEIAPALELPGDGPLADALAALGPGQDVRRAGPPLDVHG